MKISDFKNSKIPILLFMVFATGLTISCNNDDDDLVGVTPEQNIVEVASANTDFSTLVAALQKAELTEVLSGTGPFTVFAPTNAAFTAAGITNLDNFTAEQLRPILLYHVISGRNQASGLSSRSYDTQNENADLYLSVGSAGVTINGNSQVTTADISASNGVIHAINNILIPPSQNIVQIAAEEDDFSLLVRAVTRAGLAETLSTTDGLTVFAPTNTAFEDAGLDEAAIDATSVEDLTSILTYHVIAARVFSSDLTNDEVETLEGGTVTTGIGSGGATVRGNGNESASNITAANILATNGVIHVIDQVLLPQDDQGTIVDVAVSNSDFSILVEALQKAGLVDALNAEGPYTVFAPTNAAFEAAGITSVDDLTAEQLTPILLYHVLGQRKESGDLESGSEATLNEDADIFLSVTDDGVYINGNTMVATADVQASNGVIHVIDQVLMPPSENVVEIAAANEDFSLLVRAVTRAGLAETLATTEGITVFAPTDDAFLAAGLDAEAIDNTPVDDLVTILTYHVVAARVFSTDLSDGEVETLEGSNVVIDLSSGATVSGASNTDAANIDPANILATNGVIHVIDQVLLP
jgi:transforming growth factor-beta-induced protein